MPIETYLLLGIANDQLPIRSWTNGSKDLGVDSVQAWLLDRTAMRSKSFWSFLLGTSERLEFTVDGCEMLQLIGALSSQYSLNHPRWGRISQPSTVQSVSIVCQHLLEH